MPIFEYHCKDCGSNFEKLVLSSKDKVDSVACSECSSESVEKLFSTFAAQSSNGEGATCANQAAGVCQAGGGPMPCGMG